MAGIKKVGQFKNYNWLFLNALFIMTFFHHFFVKKVSKSRKVCHKFALKPSIYFMGESNLKNKGVAFLIKWFTMPTIKKRRNEMLAAAV